MVTNIPLSPYKNFLKVMGLSVLATACSSGLPTNTEMANETPPPSENEPVKVGTPYQINGQWYYPSIQPNYDEVGMASWYGPQFHGNKTANGEIFDMNKLTAAHKTLPLPSYVRVTNLSNGRNMVIRVNDRGPYAPNRIIDLSRRAAQLLGFHDKGIERVRVQLVNYDGSPIVAENKDVSSDATLDTAPATMGFYVQLGSFSDRNNATAIAKDAQELGDTIVQSVDWQGKTLYRVRLGPYKSELNARRVLIIVKEKGFEQAAVFLEKPES